MNLREEAVEGWKKKEEGGDPDPNPRDEKTWLVDQSAEGSKFRYEHHRSPSCVSLIPLSTISCLRCLFRQLIFFICKPAEIPRAAIESRVRSYRPSL